MSAGQVQVVLLGPEVRRVIWTSQETSTILLPAFRRDGECVCSDGHRPPWGDFCVLAFKLDPATASEPWPVYRQVPPRPECPGRPHLLCADCVPHWWRDAPPLPRLPWWERVRCWLRDAWDRVGP